jgi:peptide/nickel transport system substrate-binding protein
MRLGRIATNEADRAKAHAQIQEKVMKEHLWIPVMNVKMYQTTNKKLKGARAHMLYQYTFYKGLDVSP